MLSAGLIGGPGLGYCKDRFAGEALKESKPAIHAEYRSEMPSRFLNIPSTEVFGLDGRKVAAARDAGPQGTDDQKAVVAADQQGDRQTLLADSYIPATMAAIYLAFLLYFWSIGGYRRVELTS